MKELTLLLTGLSDEALADLDGKTPFDIASHPTLDWMAEQGSVTAFCPPKKGGEETALFSLLDVEADVAPGPLVARALGLEAPSLESGTAYCGRFIAVGGDTIVDVADSLASDQEGAHLCQLLSTPDLTFHHLEGAQFLLLADGEAQALPLLSPSELVGRPWKKLLPKGTLRPKLLQLADQMAGDELNELRLEMEEEPVNGLYLWGGGVLPASVPDRREGSTLSTNSRLLQGVAHTLGLPLGKPPPVELKDSLQIPSHLDKVDHLILELPYLWQSTYKGDLREKIKRIEWLDRHLIAPLLDWCAGTARLTVMPLRHTSIRLGKTMPGPVSRTSFP